MSEHLDRNRATEPPIPATVRDREGTGADLLVHLEAASQDLADRVANRAGVGTLTVHALSGLLPRWRAFDPRMVLGHV